MKKHTLIVSDLDDHEAEMIASILSDYISDIQDKKISSMIEDKKDNGSRVKWYDDHLAWYKTILAKVSWISK